MRRLVLSAVFLASFATPAFGKWYEENCFNQVVTKNVMLRKYDYKYTWGSSETLTKGKEGSSHVTSQNSTQGTTAGVDPGYTTGVWQMYSMSTSSKKPCEVFGDNYKEREKFTAANSDGLKHDIARGDGPSLRAFAALSGCEDAVMARYFQAMRKNYDTLALLEPAHGALSSAIDAISDADELLAANCKI